MATFGGLLHHLPNDTHHEVLNLAARSLKPGRRMIKLDPCFVEGSSTIAQYGATHARKKIMCNEPGYAGMVERHLLG